MINFNKNKLINKTLDKYYETFSHTLDTADYVPEKFNTKIHKYIYKNMKKAFRKIDKEDYKYQKELKQKLRLEIQEKKRKEKAASSEEKSRNKFVLFFKMLFLRKHKNVKELSENSCDNENCLDSEDMPLQ